MLGHVRWVGSKLSGSMRRNGFGRFLTPMPSRLIQPLPKDGLATGFHPAPADRVALLYKGRVTPPPGIVSKMIAPRNQDPVPPPLQPTHRREVGFGPSLIPMGVRLLGRLLSPRVPQPQGEALHRSGRPGHSREHLPSRGGWGKRMQSPQPTDPPPHLLAPTIPIPAQDRVARSEGWAAGAPIVAGTPKPEGTVTGSQRARLLALVAGRLTAGALLRLGAWYWGLLWGQAHLDLWADRLADVGCDLLDWIEGATFGG